MLVRPQHIIREGVLIRDLGERIDFLSRHFIGIPYMESTLKGDRETPEEFVINLEGVDCMTFIEYVEAMRLSGSFEDFIENLKVVRYYDDHVSFRKRRHFFTDWIDRRDAIKDVTPLAGGKITRVVKKTLNLKEDGSLFIPGIPVVERKIFYIPSGGPEKTIREDVMERLQTGDYAGIYTPRDGLDVSHVGIIIKKDNNIYLRHASSMEDKRKVVDEDLREYMKGKDGLIILRPV